jgi:hypothetical protein
MDRAPTVDFSLKVGQLGDHENVHPEPYSNHPEPREACANFSSSIFSKVSAAVPEPLVPPTTPPARGTFLLTMQCFTIKGSIEGVSGCGTMVMPFLEDDWLPLSAQRPCLANPRWGGGVTCNAPAHCKSGLGRYPSRLFTVYTFRTAPCRTLLCRLRWKHGRSSLFSFIVSSCRHNESNTDRDWPRVTYQP